MNLLFGPGFHTILDKDINSMIYVRVLIDDVETDALLDTGAQWSVLKWDLVQALELPYDGESIRYETRFGSVDGKLCRYDVVLPSEDESHSSLKVDATFFVSENWTSNQPNIIGYRSFLENIRFGIDPIQRVFCFCEPTHL